MYTDGCNGWAANEFESIDLGDQRLNQRLVKICDSFAEAPESPINQSCDGWAETKAAYRFFKNEKVDESKIMNAHADKTAARSQMHKTILAAQDTSYFIYTSHKKTDGLGKISMKKNKYVEEIHSHGLVMHSSLALTTDGTPLGLLAQKIFVRQTKTPSEKKQRDVIPIEDKESYRWLESLKSSKEVLGETQVVTVCDREADIYEFFKLSKEISAPILVRAKANRTVNKASRFAEKSGEKLWDFVDKLSDSGSFQIEIPQKPGVSARITEMKLKFGNFIFNAPKNNIKHRKERLPDLDMNLVYVYEENPPKGVEKVEWLLLTNLLVANFEGALEKVRWYSLRWRIEMFHKVLKSGFKVEDCRLASAERLIKYLTIMSIVACRMFMITLISRTNPNLPCTNFLSDEEWKVLFVRATKKKKFPKKPPLISTAIIWIAKLGGFLARKGDGFPGTLALWRGWKRLNDLTSGWNLAMESKTYG